MPNARNEFPELPDFLRISQEDRSAAWKGIKLTKPKDPRRPTRVEDPQTRAFRKQMEQIEAAKKAARLKHLKENYRK